jgi:hydroxymethylbilane synthase
MRSLRIATRGSDLALTQARGVARRIEQALGLGTELVPIKTSGDRLLDTSLAKLGGKGLFVKEIEEALLQRRADLAVHSAKDLPARLPPGLTLAVFLERADPRDALLCRERGQRLDDLSAGAHVGTGSLRRAAQLRVLRPDLRIEPLRGNVPTRLRRLEEGEFDALVLACAGLDRLGCGERIDQRLDPTLLLPAVGQGALALEVREEDPLAQELVALDHGETAQAVACERAFLNHLGGDCNTPLAALAERRDEAAVRLRALLANPSGTRILRAESEAANPETAGVEAAESILARGGAEILAALRESESS